MTTYTVSGDVATLLGGDHSDGDPVALWIECSQPIMTVDSEGRLGGRMRVTVATDGTFSVADLPGSVSDIPLYRLVIDSRSLRLAGQKSGLTTGWFPLAADRDLTWIVANYVTTTIITEQIAANVAAAAALGATNDTATASFVADSGSATTAALSATYEARGGGVIAAAANGVATGNTAAANTAALNNLHTSALALGATIILPAGTIPVTTLNLKAPMVGAGKGKTVLSASGTLTLSDSKVRLADLSVLSATATAISAANQTDFTLERISLDWTGAVATAWLGLDAYNIDRLRVAGCSFRIGGIQLSLCDDFLVDGNYWDCEYVNTNEPCHITGQSSGQFVNNSIYQTLTDGLDLYSAGEYCVIANNRFIGLRGASGIEVKVSMSDDSGNTSGAGNVIDGVVIANNVLRDFNATATGTRQGIYAEYVDNRGTPAFAVSETNRALIITGNVLEDFEVTDPGAGVVATYWGIAYTGHNGLVTNNVVRNLRGWQGAQPIGIRLAQPTGSKCVGVRVAGNVIAGVENYAGIEVGTLDHCQIDDNIIRGDEVNGIQTKFGVSIASGKTLTGCSISGNTFECNTANSYGIRGAATSAVLSRCRVQGNILRDCGVLLYAVQYCSFVGNIMDNATNSQGFNVGVTGTSCRGNTYTGNHITMSSDYGLVLTDHNGFVILGNTFNATNRAVLLSGTTKDGIVDANVSIVQSGGTEFPHYSGPLPDLATVQASMSVGANKVLAA